MLIQYPQLMGDVQRAVIVTELTLAAARDTIRILSWMKTNASQIEVFVLANRMHAGAQLEISRKDFEGSIEHKIDYVVPFDQKLAAQAAKLGTPIVEAGKTSKTVAPIVALAAELAAVVPNGGVHVAKVKSKSLMNKFGELKGLIPRRPAKVQAK
jgi:pilus assembly protein CpaE